MNRYKELFKNTGILAISQFSSKILVFLLVPLYTSVLSTAEYGVYDLTQSTIQMLVPLLTVNIVDAVMRFLMDRDADQSAIITVGIRYLFLGLGLAGTIMIVLKALGLFPSIDGLELLIFIYFVASMFQQFMVQTAKGLDYVQAMGVAGALGTFATILGCILCLLVFDMGLKGFYIANISGQIVPAVYIGIRVKIWKYCGFGITERRIRLVHKEMLIYCVPLLSNTLGWQVNNYFDKYVVVFMMGEAANGLLGVAYKIPTILVTLQSIFNQAWQISAVKGYQDNNRSELYCNIFAMMNLVMSLSCSSLIFIIKILAKILFAKDFFAAWEFVPILLVSSVVNASAGVLGAILGAQKNSRAMAIAGFAGIVVNIVLNILLVDKMGVQGAVIATLISSLVIYAVRQISVKSFFNKEIVLKALISWGLLIVQSIVASRLQTSIGYLIQVLLIAMLVVCNWRYTKKIFNMGLKIIFKKEKS